MVKNDAGGRRQDRFVIMLAAKFNGEGRIVDAGGCAFISSARYCGEVPKKCNTRLSWSEEQTRCATVPYTVIEGVASLYMGVRFQAREDEARRTKKPGLLEEARRSGPEATPLQRIW